MNLAELESKLSNDPEYIAAGRAMKPMIDLANNVIALRVLRKMSRIALGNQSRTGYDMVCDIESALANPRISELRDIANALDATLVISLVPNEKTDATEV